MSAETELPAVEPLPASAAAYMELVTNGLQKAVFQSRFDMHYPAPPDLDAAQMDTLAATLRGAGWKAEVTTGQKRRQGAFGLRIYSDND